VTLILKGAGQRERLARSAQAGEAVRHRLGDAARVDEHRHVGDLSPLTTRQVEILLDPALALEDAQAGIRDLVRELPAIGAAVRVLIFFILVLEVVVFVLLLVGDTQDAGRLRGASGGAVVAELRERWTKRGSSRPDRGVLRRAGVILDAVIARLSFPA
jgi:hypothetical protein